MDKDRFASYIPALREFSASHQVHAGASPDLISLPGHLQSSTEFRAEFRSMIRSVVYGEQGRASTADLVNLVAVSWGGVQVADGPDSSPQLQTTLADLRGFLSKVMVDEHDETNAEEAPSSWETFLSADAVPDGQALRGKRQAFPIRGEEPSGGLPAAPDTRYAEAEEETAEVRGSDLHLYARLLRERVRNAVVLEPLPPVAVPQTLAAVPTPDAALINAVPNAVSVAMPTAVPVRVLDAAPVAVPDPAPKAVPGPAPEPVVLPPAPYDPWAEDSLLHRELQRFAEEPAYRRSARQRRRPSLWLAAPRWVFRSFAGYPPPLRRESPL